MPHLVAGPRVGVSNLDAMEQTRLWRMLGPEEATRTMLAAFRSAVLLGETVLLDRNQILEGIFFVAVDPDRLAWMLGLEPGAPLPITVALINNGAGPASLASEGPWRTSAGRRWAVDPELERDIDLNYEAVAGDVARVSSPLIAMTGNYANSVVATQESVNAPDHGPGWLRADPRFLPQELWKLRDDVLARELIERGRIAWVTAMKTGRVRVEPFRRRPLDLGAALEAAPVPQGRARPLAEAIFAVQERGGQTAPCAVVHRRWSEGDEEQACGRHHVTKRSLLVRWLDGEVVDELDPPRLPSELHALFGVPDRDRAIRWWTAAYYDAIATRDELRLLTLYNIQSDALGGKPGDAEELDWGLQRAPQSRRAALVARTRRRVGRGPRDVVIEGELVRHLGAMPPAQFAQLRGYESVDFARLWSAPDSRTMFDLALAARDLAGDHVPRETRVKIQLLRFTALAALAAVFSLRDGGLLPVQGTLWVAVWILLAMVAAFPYAEFGSLTKLSSGRMQSVVRLRDTDR